MSEKTSVPALPSTTAAISIRWLSAGWVTVCPGDDRASGGLAVYSNRGELLWARPNAQVQREVYGLAVGAVFRGLEDQCYAPDGRLLWQLRREGNKLIELPQLDISLQVDERFAGAPFLIQQLGKNLRQELHRTVDLGNNSYFGRLLWSPHATISSSQWTSITVYVGPSLCQR